MFALLRCVEAEEKEGRKQRQSSVSRMLGKEHSNVHTSCREDKESCAVSGRREGVEKPGKNVRNRLHQLRCVVCWTMVSAVGRMVPPLAMHCDVGVSGQVAGQAREETTEEVAEERADASEEPAEERDPLDDAAEPSGTQLQHAPVQPVCPQIPTSCGEAVAGAAQSNVSVVERIKLEGSSSREL